MYQKSTKLDLLILKQELPIMLHLRFGKISPIMTNQMYGR